MAPGEQRVEVLELGGRGQDRRRRGAAVSVMNCSITTVNRSSRRRPASTRSWSGAICAGFDDQTTSAATGGSSSGSVSASPSCDMLIWRTSPARRSRPVEHGARDRARGRGRDVGAAAAAVAPRRRPAPAGRRSSGRRSARRGGAGRRRRAASSAGWVRANSRATSRDLSAVDAADLGPVLDRVLGEPLEQLVIAVGVCATPLLVGESGVDDRAHHSQRQGGVGARERAQVLVGDPRGAAAERVDDHQPRPRFAAPRGSSSTGAGRSTSGSSPRRARSGRAATPRGRPPATGPGSRPPRRSRRWRRSSAPARWRRSRS